MLRAPPATTTTSACAVWRSPPLVDVFHADGTCVFDQHALDYRLRTQLEPAMGQGVVDVRVHRRLAGVRRTALETGAAAHAVLVRVRPHRLELDAQRAEAGLDRVHALRPVRPLADAEHLLDPVVVGLKIGRFKRRARVVREPGGGMPLGDVALVGAQGHLRVDRRRAAHAASGEERDDVAVGERRQAQRPPDVVVRVSLPAHEVRGGAVGPASSNRTSRPRWASSPATTPPPAPDPTTTTSNRSFMRPPGTTSPCSASSRAES